MFMHDLYTSTREGAISRGNYGLSKVKWYQRPSVVSFVAAVLVGYNSILYFGSWPTSNMLPPDSGSTCFQCEYINAVNYISDKRKKIAEVAGKYGLPPELLASTLLNENRGREKRDDWMDGVCLFFGKNPSIGIGQIRVSTAMEMWERLKGEALPKDKAVGMLMDPDTNLELMAMFYREQLDIMGHTKDAIKGGLLLEPAIFVELVARYTGGPGYKTVKSEEAWLAGVNALVQLSDPDFCGKRTIGAETPVKNFGCKVDMKKMEDFLAKNRKRVNSALVNTSDPRFGGLKERPISAFLNGKAPHIQRR